MEEQFKNEDRIIKKLISEAGLEKPNSEFRDTLMMQIEAKASEKLQFTPLISRNGWLVFILFVAVAVAMIILIPTETTNSPLSEQMSKFSNLLPEYEVSRTVLYSTMFLALFLLQIPLLKKFLNGRAHRY